MRVLGVGVRRGRLHARKLAAKEVVGEGLYKQGRLAAKFLDVIW